MLVVRHAETTRRDAICYTIINQLYNYTYICNASLLPYVIDLFYEDS